MREHKPVNIIPFYIYNRKAFIEAEHPIIHPREDAYDEYWFSVTEKVIYGKWGFDSNGSEGGWRWMPGCLYFYINCTVIEKQGEDNTTVTDPPSLRDIDWLKAYGSVAKEGFSGFEDDDEYTCYRIVEKIENGEDLRNYERKMLENEFKYIKKKDGTYKKYIEAREYLYLTKDKPLGKPLWRNVAKNFLELGTRGYGKSYWLAGGEITYDYVCNGCKNMESLLDQKNNTVIVVGASISRYTDDLLKKFSVTYEYLRTKVGYYFDGEAEYPGWFWQPYDGQLGLDGKPFTNRTVEKGGQGYIGAGSLIYNVSYNKNNQAGVGKRARKFIIDEAGTLSNFKEVHAENSAAQNRETKFGSSIYSGTGGEMTKIDGIRDAFSNPLAYDILAYKDLFGFNNSFTGLFIPCYYRKDIYRDENGNINLQEAFDDEVAERNIKLKESVEAYDKHIISYPFYPHEMFMQAKLNLFPTPEMEERLFELEGGEWNRIAKVGWLEYTNNQKTEVRFNIDLKGDLVPLNRHGSEKKAKSKKGAIVIYEPPVQDKPNPTFLMPLYLVLYDPVQKDGDGSSINAVIVFKFWHGSDLDSIQFNIVAEWYGRMATLDENHEVAFMLATLYGAKIFPETNNQDIKRHARDTLRWNMLQPKPNKALGKYASTKIHEVGFEVPPGFKPTLEIYLNEIFNVIVEKKDGNPIKMARKIPSIRVLDEALKYGDGNFDAISAMFLLSLIYRNTMLIQNQKPELNDTDIDEYRTFIRKKPYNQAKRHPAFIK